MFEITGKAYQADCINGRPRYTPDYSGRDEWIDLDFDYRMLSVSHHYGEEGESIYLCRFKVYYDAPEDFNLADFRKVLADNFRRGCSCSHDCCGHYFGGLGRVFKPANHRKDEYMATFSYSPNY